jgi:hypothetical protein
VVGDDVEVDLHPAPVRGVDERAQVLVGAEVRVDLGEVGDPVAVVAGALVLLLHRLVLEAGREPDRGRAEAPDVVDPLEQALEVAAVVEAAPLGREAGLTVLDAGRQAAVVVRAVPVLEAVGHHEVEALVGHRRPQRVLRLTRPCGRCGDARGERGDEHSDGGAVAQHPFPLPPDFVAAADSSAGGSCATS